MKAEWPSWQVTSQSATRVVWSGRLEVFGRFYTLSVAYQVPPPPLIFAPGGFLPRIKVQNPSLHRRAQAPDEPIPHVFWREGGPELCVYDPAALEWSGRDLIARTIVYWASRWLHRYEGWQVTGVWHGKARGHGPIDRFHPDSGTPLRWRDRWTSTTSDLALRSPIPNSVDRRGWDQRNLPSFSFVRFRAAPVRGPLRR